MVCRLDLLYCSIAFARYNCILQLHCILYNQRSSISVLATVVVVGRDRMDKYLGWVGAICMGATLQKRGPTVRLAKRMKLNQRDITENGELQKILFKPKGGNLPGPIVWFVPTEDHGKNVEYSSNTEEILKEVKMKVAEKIEKKIIKMIWINYFILTLPWKQRSHTEQSP